MSEPQTETQVLIAGGGPTGLSAAAELETHGIDTVIVEPRTYVSHTNPRAKLTNVRTMEHFRRLGLADDIREAANLPVDWSQEVVFCTSLLGDELARFDNVFGQNESEQYAETAQQIPQYLVEETLREGVREMSSVSLETGWRVESIEQDEDGVRATVVCCIERHSISEGERREISANYLLGCDGSRSTVRDQIGSSFEGDVNPRNNLGVVFRAPDLAERHHHGPAVHYWTLNNEIQGFMGRLDLEDKWWLIAVGVDDPNAVDPREIITKMAGDEVDAKVLTTDPWSARMLLVDNSRSGRVFLVGDAAHLNPPWGGHGYNTGVGDAIDIGWKVAAVLNGWGGPELLDTYEAERRDVHEDVIDISTTNMESSPADLISGELDSDENVDEDSYEDIAQEIYEKKKLEFHSLGLILGYAYDGSPIVVEEEAALPETGTVEYHPTSYPGSRLPHSWLSEDRSIYDLLGEGLSLVRFDREIDVSPFMSASETTSIPLEVVDVDHEDVARSYEQPLLLVRPDQHVAWRGSRCPDDAESILRRVCGYPVDDS
ncbi:2-polyprenyl-6-methoxyphenol hydroxylase [Natrarchaeobius halalkaliphilus]|uniref:2-polyprenyl-6-methoxyphenol hydroxylase n=1 Tax=Natrarchaeobius halalkaliphilus TaxID=1679091 RepID=A0A3N6LYW8_9EURY|nr:FAD-dependent monooxygenase [Natrarchaeobius halalkaliphilus]RQG87893.1 2-polyprenyl-6-methoxyphenol hydroxylase [Natrarchaeobius halalkaliphilus]